MFPFVWLVRNVFKSRNEWRASGLTSPVKPNLEYTVVQFSWERWNPGAIKTHCRMSCRASWVLKSLFWDLLSPARVIHHSEYYLLRQDVIVTIKSPFVTAWSLLCERRRRTARFCGVQSVRPTHEWRRYEPTRRSRTWQRNANSGARHMNVCHMRDCYKRWQINEIMVRLWLSLK